MGATNRRDGALRPKQRDAAVPGCGRAVGRSDAGSRRTPTRALCVRTAVHSLPLLPQGTCDLPKSSEGGSQRSPGYRLICVTHDLPAELPMLGPSQGLAFLRTCLQLMSFLPHFCLKLGLSCF